MAYKDEDVDLCSAIPWIMVLPVLLIENHLVQVQASVHGAEAGNVESSVPLQGYLQCTCGRRAIVFRHEWYEERCQWISRVQTIKEEEKMIEVAATAVDTVVWLLQHSSANVQVLISSYSRISEDEYLDPRTAQVGKIGHVRQASLWGFDRV